MTHATMARDDVGVPASLPTDAIRQIMWRFADREDLQSLVQAARAVARGPVARLVADGARQTREWTEGKRRMLAEFDRTRLGSLTVDAEDGGLIAGPASLARSLAAFELAWVDAGAAACCIAIGFALGPIVECGTPEQKQRYLRSCLPSPGEQGPVAHAAFCLTEPLPYAGVDTGVLSGKVRVVEWREGHEPILQVEKRGRLTGNMDFANFVVATVASDDPRIGGTCMVILEEGDVGTFDRGVESKKLGHQLCSTRDPVFRLQVPASRIVGGYAIKDGVIVPHRNHLDVLRPIFTRVRAPVGIMAAAKLLSAVEPVIRYQRERFGGSDEAADVLHRERGLQTHEDAVHRLVDVWATGEAAASLGFAAARQLDDVDSLDRERDAIFAALGVQSPAAVREARQEAARLALEYVQLASAGEADREQSRWEELNSNRLVELALKECVSNVLSPAAKLWNTSQGSAMLREAVSLMGGTGVLENCPGFLPQKWFDSQIEATYEGPESVHRRQLATSMANEVFLAQFAQWLDDLRRLAARQPGTGACTVASAMAVWLWTLRRLQDAKDADGLPLFRDQRQGATFPMADALDWLLASRCQILDVVELQTRGPQCESSGESLAGCLGLLTDLCHVQAARAAGEVARICTDLLFGYNRHPSWDAACGHCLPGDEIDALEGVIPGISVGARIAGDVIEADGSHDQKAGPCVRFAGLYEFVRRRSKLDGCLTGARLAKDRAARSLAQITIPVALDYPQ